MAHLDGAKDSPIGERAPAGVLTAEREFLLNQQQLEDAEELAQAGSWDRDLLTGRLSWSAGGYRLFRLDPAETRLDFAGFIEMVHPDDRARLLRTIERAQSEQGVFESEYRIARKDGQERVLHVRGRFFRDASGRPVRSLGRIHDVTELRRQEQIIREQRQALVHSEALAAIGSLAASVAHEINNPLAFVLLNLEEVLKESQRDAGAQSHARARIHDLTEEALEGVRRIGAIVKNLKAISGAQHTAKEPVDPVHALDVALSMAASSLRQRARLVREVASVPRVVGDEVRLSQVLLNLLVNAAGAIPEGRPEENEVRVTAREQPGGEVVLEVHDTGCGIPPENLERIFEPFFTTKSAEAGTGLGLSISRQIVQELGGRIEVRSTVGVGSVFTVRLRAAPGGRQPEGPSPGSAEQPVAKPRSVRLLVADDERLIRKAITRALPACTVVEADDGESAQRLLETDRDFDLILCDLMMPRTTGMDLHEWLLGVDPGLAARMVFITGGAFSEQAQEFLSRDGVRSLEKPFDFESLHALVAEAR